MMAARRVSARRVAGAEGGGGEDAAVVVELAEPGDEVGGGGEVHGEDDDAVGEFSDLLGVVPVAVDDERFDAGVEVEEDALAVAAAARGAEVRKSVVGSGNSIDWIPGCARE